MPGLILSLFSTEYPKILGTKFISELMSIENIDRSKPLGFVEK